MSTTYSIACKKCKEKYWAGQRDYLYSLQNTADFLHKHIGHELVFISDLADEEEFEEYSEYDNTHLKNEG